MKLLIKQNRRPDISFNWQGSVNITTRVAKMLDLKEGDVINIAEQDNEFYLFVQYRAQPNGAFKGRVYATNEHNGFLRARNTMLCRKMIAECDAAYCARLYVGDPVEVEGIGRAVPIITRLNLDK